MSDTWAMCGSRPSSDTTNLIDNRPSPHAKRIPIISRHKSNVSKSSEIRLMLNNAVAGISRLSSSFRNLHLKPELQ